MLCKLFHFPLKTQGFFFLTHESFYLILRNMATVITRGKSPTILYRNTWPPLTTGLSSFTSNTKKAHRTQRLSNGFTQTALLEKEKAQI